MPPPSPNHDPVLPHEDTKPPRTCPHSPPPYSKPESEGARSEGGSGQCVPITSKQWPCSRHAELVITFSTNYQETGSEDWTGRTSHPCGRWGSKRDTGLNCSRKRSPSWHTVSGVFPASPPQMQHFILTSFVIGPPFSHLSLVLWPLPLSISVQKDPESVLSDVTRVWERGRHAASGFCACFIGILLCQLY